MISTLMRMMDWKRIVKDRGADAANFVYIDENISKNDFSFIIMISTLMRMMD